MKSKREALEQKVYEISSKMYQAQGAQPGAAPDMGGAPQPEPGKPDDGVVDADYTEVE